MPRIPKRTQTDVIREAIADRIIQGYLKPGEALDETMLAAVFGVSRTPVREALRQLEANGLAQSRPHRGAIVASMTETELDEVFAVMAELEGFCARLCAQRMPMADAQALSAMHEAAAAHVRDGAIEDFREHNERFHTAIYAGAGNNFLEETTAAVRRRLAPFRRLQFDADHRIDESQVEHGRVVAAILARRPDDAAEGMRSHLENVRRTVDRVIDYGSARAVTRRDGEAKAEIPEAGGA